MNTSEAIDLVGSGVRNWSDDCYQFAERWIKGNTKYFTSEDIIHDFEMLHNFRPAEKRVWGHVMRRLSRCGLIEKVGIGVYRGIQGNSRPVNVWKSNN